MKKLLALALALLLLLSCAPFALAEEAEEVSLPPVSIASLADFLAFAEGCALESYSKGREFRLETDLDLSGADFSPIPYFAGSFLGGGHSIRGLELRGDGSRVGLFRQIAENASVRDLAVRGRVTPGGTRLQVGGIVGENRGTIENCSFEGSVQGLENVGGIAGSNGSAGRILDCRFDGEVVAEHQAGGIAGDNLGLIHGCRSEGKVNNAQIIPERSPGLGLSSLSDFDLSAFSEDDFLDLSNIGGIAGANGGVISGCRNEAVVGYAWTGYNVGGIAGKSSGYLFDCENGGPIHGRRDAGGIVGQLLPHAVWDFSEDRLKGLAEELQRMNELLEATSRDTRGGAAALQGQLDALRGSASDALDEMTGVMTYYTGGMTGDLIPLDQVEIDPETGLPSLPGVSPTGADFSGLSVAMDRIYTQSAALSDELGKAAGDLNSDLTALSAQLDRVLASMNELLGAARGEETLFQSYDLSADEAYEHDLGAVDSCRNLGPIEAESSAGGIAGSMAYELSFDMEDRLRVSEFLSSDARRYVFAVLRDCESSADVSARADCAGGVIGRAELGAVVSCVGKGAVSSLKGDYVGGVAGSSGGSILSCWSRTELSGGKYLGGVAGSGANILDCASWTEFKGGSEYLGAVAGWAEGEVRGNRYVETLPAGIDGVSLEGQCEPLPAAGLLALDGVPEGFGELELRFYVGERLIETRTLPFGGSLDELPTVPDDGARRWRWEDFDREHITRSMDVRGSYCAPQTVLSSGEEPPLFLVEGEFAEGMDLSVEPYDAQLPGEALIAAWTLSVEGYADELTVRLRAEDGGRLCTVEEGGSLREIPYERDKSYLVFPLENGGSFVYLRQEAARRWLPWAAAGGGGLLLIGAVLLIRSKRKKAAPAAAEEKA
ncbi:MAG: GLUG motif-containing protein [Clostridia bacterium]